MPASAAAPSGHSFSRARASAKPAAVAPEHLDIGHQVVAERHRLRGLQMGEARHDGRRHAPRRGRSAPPAGRCSAAIQRVDRVAHPQPEVGRDLVVARARGVQPAGRPRRSARPAAPRRSCGCLRARGVEREAAARRISPATASSPARMASRVGRDDDALRAPAWRHAPSSAAMSCRHSRLSKSIEALIACMIADGPAAKRPPQMPLILPARSFGSSSLMPGAPRPEFGD